MSQTATDQKEIKIKAEGVVTESMQNTKYKVEVEIQGIKHELTGYISGKMRKHYIKIGVGDRVVVELSPYDLDMGRIIYKMDSRRQTPDFIKEGIINLGSSLHNESTT